jgi:hypothetical protein
MARRHRLPKKEKRGQKRKKEGRRKNPAHEKRIKRKHRSVIFYYPPEGHVEESHNGLARRPIFLRIDSRQTIQVEPTSL